MRPPACRMPWSSERFSWLMTDSPSWCPLLGQFGEPACRLHFGIYPVGGCNPCEGVCSLVTYLCAYCVGKGEYSACEASTDSLCHCMCRWAVSRGAACAPASVWTLSTCLSCRSICCMPIRTPAAGASLCTSGLAGLRMCGPGQVKVSLSWLLI